MIHLIGIVLLTNVAIFFCNASFAILQSKFLFLFPFELVLEKFVVFLKH